MKHRYLKNVATLNLNPDKCVGCERCLDVCPHGVLSLESGKAIIIDKNSCMECGACAMNCPMSVISVEANVGCAAAIIFGWLTGKEAACGCSDESDSLCC
jgi:NAD-dependent dihydropyrimidine dehydrogenase PreA subunit